MRKILRGVPGIHFQEFDAKDVVRHQLVSRIVAAYDKYDADRAARWDAEAEHQAHPEHIEEQS